MNRPPFLLGKPMKMCMCTIENCYKT